MASTLAEKCSPRAVALKVREMADKLCPPRKAQNEDAFQRKKMEGMAYGFMLVWVTIQTVVFTILIIAFLFSEDSEYMKTEDCCPGLCILYIRSPYPLFMLLFLLPCVCV